MREANWPWVLRLISLLHLVSIYTEVYDCLHHIVVQRSPKSTRGQPKQKKSRTAKLDMRAPRWGQVAIGQIASRKDGVYQGKTCQRVEALLRLPKRRSKRFVKVIASVN